MDNLTDIQQSIVDYASTHNEAPPSEIADVVGCSPSYAGTIRSRYLPAILGDIDLYESNIIPSYSNPYSIFADKCILSNSSLEIGDLAEIVMENETDELTYAFPLQDIEELDSLTESHPLLIALERDSSIWIDGLNQRLEKFQSDDGYNIYDSGDFSDFVDEVLEFVESSLKNADLVIGWQIFRNLADNEYDHFNRINIPEGLVPPEYFEASYAGDYNRILDLKTYTGDISEPDEAYFTTHRPINNMDSKAIADMVKNRRYFDTNILHHFETEDIHGPIVRGIPSRVVDLKDTGIHINKHLIRTDSEDGLSVEYADIKQIVEDTDFYIQSESDDEDDVLLQPYYFPNTNSIAFSFGNVTVRIASVSDGIITSYPNINGYPHIAESIIEVVRERLEIASDPEFNTSKASDKSTDEWIWDTNALYHEIIDERGSCVLKSVFTNDTFFYSNIVIPWISLYEINKHKDRGGPSTTVQKKGIDNIDVFRKLAEIGLIQLEIDGKIGKNAGPVDEADIADMLILDEACERESAGIVSGDDRLRKLGEFAGIASMNIRDIADVTNTPDLDDAIKNEILPKIGDILSSETDLRGAINEEVEQQIQQKMPREKTDAPESASAYINRWLDDKEIIAFPDGDSLRYDHGVPNDLVITPTAAVELGKHIEEGPDGRYLSEECILHLVPKLRINQRGVPWITFHVPISAIIASQSAAIGGISTEARHLHQLNQLKNADYETAELSEAISRQETVHDSVLLAREKSLPLLCADADDYLTTISQLLDVKILEFEM
ncbi:hypothetical protein [Halomarina oriensis]|uniref:PIN domain-containing protein n=1 Tax=Halomarina oriensis TaxID=671145 RepID=A0A6B0GJW2_9EURY|nr:hypothetical protein [Halomarina oriensis]MWG34151.1 hypothetical protein [Halomarina oriensis]